MGIQNNFSKEKMEITGKAKEKLKNLLQTGKEEKEHRKKPRPLYLYNKAACLQNIQQIIDWKSGDPNEETTPTYDLIWGIWLLRKIFPKDIVTHFIQLIGGFNFCLHRSLNNPKLILVYWKYNTDLMETRFCREIYFNIPLEKIQRKKGKTYIYYIQGKSFYLE